MRALVMVGVSMGLTLTSGAQTWDGGAGASNNWSAPANWSPDGAPLNNGTANILFLGTIRLSSSVDIPWDINSLTFGSTAGAFTIGGSALTIRGGVTNSSLNAQSINSAVVLGAVQTFDSGFSQLTFGGAVNNGGYLLTLEGGNSSSPSVISGVISGSGRLTKQDFGEWLLSGSAANTYNGTTTILQGTLTLNKSVSDGAIQGHVIIGDNVNSSGTATLALASTNNQIANTSDVTVNSSGVFDLVTTSATSETIRALTVNGGTVRMHILTLSGDLTMTGGAITNRFSGAGPLTLGGNVVTNGSVIGASISSVAVNLGGATRSFTVAD